MTDQENTSGQGSQPQAPVVIRQGGNGLGAIVAALIIAGAAIYSINVWSTTKKKLPQARTWSRNRTAEGRRGESNGISPVRLKTSWS
jgi:uncharacterized protein HemX